MHNQVVVVGGGPAGMMAAISAAETGADVCLWERNNCLGKKLAITGKGRCNITNNAPIEEIIKNLPGNGIFLHSALNRFAAKSAMDFFTGLGVELKIERGRRVYPVSDSAHQVVDALHKCLKEYGVKIHCHRRAARILIQADHVVGIQDTDNIKQAASAIVLTTGGASYPSTGSSGDGYKIACNLGHSITALRPSLVPLETLESWPGELSGLSLKNVGLKAYYNKKPIGYEFGELLFTHFGLSGPIVLSLSCAITALPDNGAQTQLQLDLKPALSLEQLDKRLLRDLEAGSRKLLINALAGLTPAALLPLLLQLAGILPHKYAHQVTRKERLKLASLLKALPLTVKRPRPLAEAIVTAGGVHLKEIDPKTMASKKLSGLFFAGELLDVHGYTGGYNLQAAWSTGYVAGQAAALTTLLK